MERPKNEGDQKKAEKRHGARSVPSADENEKADEQVKQAHDAQVVLGRKGLLGRGCEEWCFEFLTTAGKLVAHLGPEPSTVQPPSDLRGSCDRGAIDRQQDVVGADPGASCRRLGGNPAGPTAMIRVAPRASAV